MNPLLIQSRACLLAGWLACIRADDPVGQSLTVIVFKFYSYVVPL
jgi:hypothetical protein